MEKKSDKQLFYKIVYAVCGFLLMIIDWTRGSQVGTTWAWTVNMMGVVICLILFTADGWKNYYKTKYIVFTIFMLFMPPLGYQFWLSHQTLIYRDKLLSAICNIWVLGICGIRLVEFYRGRHISIKKQLSLHEVLVMVLFLLMLVSVNEDVWPVWFLALFIVCTLWPITNDEKYQVMNGLCTGIIASFFVLQGAAFVFRPFDTDYHRYCGIYSNPNINALFYSVVLIAFSFKLFQLRYHKKNKILQVLAYLFSIATIAFIILTVSKTAWVSVFLCIALYTICLEFGKLRQTCGKALVGILVSGILLAVCIPIVYLPVRYLPPVFHHPIWYEGEYAEWRVHSWDPWDSPKYVSFQEVTSAVSERLLPVVQKVFPAELLKLENVRAAEQNPNGIYVGDKFYPYADENTLRYSSYLGRLATWHYYFTHGSILGHSNTEGHEVGIGYTYNWHAQNVFLQIWYYFGIPAGILFLVVSIGALFKSVKRAFCWDGRNGEMASFVMLFMTLFMSYGLFEAVWYPGQMIMTLAVFGPLLMKKNELKETNEEISYSSL